jgi:hypothetical protein
MPPRFTRKECLVKHQRIYRCFRQDGSSPTTPKSSDMISADGNDLHRASFSQQQHPGAQTLQFTHGGYDLSSYGFTDQLQPQDSFLLERQAEDTQQ